jgi:hypothetical protein
MGSCCVYICKMMWLLTPPLPFSTTGLIGKRGQTVTDIQDKSLATVRLSQTEEFFPGTQGAKKKKKKKSWLLAWLVSYILLERDRDKKADLPPLLPSLSCRTYCAYIR